MDLNKDNQDIYTVDRDSYSEYMQENETNSKDLLSSFIKFLLLILLIVVSYFFYKIVKADLSFSEIFNKKELMATYELFDGDDKKIYIEKEDYVEVLVENTSKDVAEPKKTAVLSAFKIHEEPVVMKVKEKVPVIEKPKPVKIVDELKEEKIIESVPAEILTKREILEATILSESYLDLVVEELNSF